VFFISIYILLDQRAPDVLFGVDVRSAPCFLPATASDFPLEEGLNGRCKREKYEYRYND
jgi:hypothetical protein